MASSNFIDKLSDEPIQEIQFVLSNNDIIYFTFRFLTNCNCWVVDIEYNNFILNSLQLTYSDNCLKQYQNILPFGLQVDSVSGLSPMQINSFSDGINRVIINEF